MYAVLYPFLGGRAQRTSGAYDLEALTGTTEAKVEFEREKSGHHMSAWGQYLLLLSGLWRITTSSVESGDR
jgi:hypothetical protein